MEPMNPINPTTSPNLPTGQAPVTSAGDAEPKKLETSWIGLAVLLLLAGLVWSYYTYSNSDFGVNLVNYAPRRSKSVEISDPATTMLEKQDTSDGVSAIEQDLNATDLNGLDKELTDIDAEFQ